MRAFSAIQMSWPVAAADLRDEVAHDTRCDFIMRMEFVAPVRIDIERGGDIRQLALELLGRLVAVHARERRIGDEIAPVPRRAEESFDGAVDEGVIAALVEQLQLQRFDLASRLGAARSAVAAMIRSAPSNRRRAGELIVCIQAGLRAPMPRPATSDTTNDQRPRTAMAIDGLASL